MAKKAAKPEAKAKPAAKKAAAKPKAKEVAPKAAAEKAKAPAVVAEVAVVEEVVAPVKPKKEKKPSAKAVKAAALQTAAAEEANKKWNSLKEKHGKEKAPNYSMSATFEANTPIQHKTFGWGFIIANENNRLEVLFESGARFLISNYKA